VKEQREIGMNHSKMKAQDDSFAVFMVVLFTLLFIGLATAAFITFFM
jgi:hypothetical protein